MKKIATILTALALMLSFAACGKTDKKPDSTSDASQTENTTVTTEPTTDTSAPETDAASDPKALLDAISKKTTNFLPQAATMTKPTWWTARPAMSGLRTRTASSI